MIESEVDPETPVRSPLRMIFSFLLLLVLPIVAGLFFASRVVPKPIVGLIRLNNDIREDTTAEIRQQLSYARQSEDIKAVVFLINSPGGSAAYSEELFLDVWSTRDRLPVVASDIGGLPEVVFAAVGVVCVAVAPAGGAGRKIASTARASGPVGMFDV